MVSMKWCNFVVCIAGLAMGGCMMGASSRFPMDMTEQGPGPGFWPFLLGLALAGYGGQPAGVCGDGTDRRVLRAGTSHRLLPCGPVADPLPYVPAGLP